jgi:hypothetical protein
VIGYGAKRREIGRVENAIGEEFILPRRRYGKNHVSREKNRCLRPSGNNYGVINNKKKEV